jgi:hypothetical protein
MMLANRSHSLPSNSKRFATDSSIGTSTQSCMDLANFAGRSSSLKAISLQHYFPDRAKRSVRVQKALAFSILPDMDSLVTIVAAAGLSGPVVDGHIHVGAPSVDGPPVRHTPRTPFGLLDVWTTTDLENPLTREHIDALFAGQYYVNLHTQKYLAGEIRGQIVPLSQQPSQARVQSFPHEGVLGLKASSNPVRESTTINFDLPYPMRVELSLIDMTGKKVWQDVQDGNKGLNNCPIHVSELSAGTYVLQLAGGGESATMNLVVTK